MSVNVWDLFAQLCAEMHQLGDGEVSSICASGFHSWTVRCGCLGYGIPCQWSAHCCYANKECLKVMSRGCLLMVCVSYLQCDTAGQRGARAFNLKCHAN